MDCLFSAVKGNKSVVNTHAVTKSTRKLLPSAKINILEQK